MIDPIPVREELERIRKDQALLQRRGDGALALAWFSEHALSRSGGGPRVPLQSVLPDDMKPVASATTNAEKTFPYIRRAFREHHRAILERAIELATEDFNAAEAR
ncbi:hypothetical protein [Sphingomonas immobilis]|uniref:Uncharacterized protein n=1 Tax=Sphingomonas immobilis TaxID=3063997 RepID=A0ABT8ZU71_9SPHN|nr:hypothetical protein [Sphingomonas sp. CA1-15]MDO7841123.1 hypothetical protein [Sphingomonas sp. CA1-15]